MYKLMFWNEFIINSRKYFSLTSMFLGCLASLTNMYAGWQVSNITETQQMRVNIFILLGKILIPCFFFSTALKYHAEN